MIRTPDVLNSNNTPNKKYKAGYSHDNHPDLCHSHPDTEKHAATCKFKHISYHVFTLDVHSAKVCGAAGEAAGGDRGTGCQRHVDPALGTIFLPFRPWKVLEP